MRVLRSKDIKKYRETQMRDGIDPITKGWIKNPVVDHNHKSGYIREVLDRESNQYLGKCERNFIQFIRWKFPDISLPELLRNIADYLEGDYSINPLHPKWVSLEIKRFSRMNKKEQDRILKENGIIPDKTNKLRTKQYRQLWKMREYSI